MALSRVSSPHAHAGETTSWVMQQLLLATLPGIAALSWYFGWGTLINLVLAVGTAYSCEAIILKLRKRPVMFYLRDCSALVSAVLLAIALPPLAPWWLIVTGTAFAIIMAKHLYGGLGYNPFNPAMVGYVVLLISFPIAMTAWPAPRPMLPEGINVPSLWSSLQIVFPMLAVEPVDAFTMATPLDAFKQNAGMLVDQFYKSETLFIKGDLAGVGWDTINVAFLMGGIYLLARRVFTWHAPIAMLATLVLMSLVFYDGGSSASKGPVSLHLFSGATMLGAFFIVTDPVTSAVSNRGRLVYGALIGFLVFTIRAWGNYPDAIAFAVLLMNFAAPFIDYYTIPRTYGHDSASSALRKKD